MFRFPRDIELKTKWLAAIPRKNWSVNESTRVCSKHFEEKDFKLSSTDQRDKRRQSRESSQLRRLCLKPSAIPHIFPGLPSYLNVPIPLERSTTSSSSTRLEKENERIERQYNDFCTQDAIESLSNLKEKLKDLTLSDDCCSVVLSHGMYFHCFNYNESSSAPKLLVSVMVLNDLSVEAYASNIKINKSHFQHLLDHGRLKNVTALMNIITHCKMLCSSDSSKDQIQFCLELAILSLQQYVSKSTQSDPHNPSKVELVKFFIEQLKLMQVAKEARHYSTDMITTAFLWQLTSCSLYKKLRELFILPSISRLRAYPGCLSVQAGSLDTGYLLQRTEHLKEKERLVTLMIDEVYTAKRIEYSNGAFVGLNEEGEPAKTVLAFMVQSTCSKFKDIVCLVPVHKLDSTLLRYWFDKVMEALKDIFFIVAVSVDNHICNRKMFVDLCGGSLQPYISHPTRDGEFLFLIFDFTHNFKNIFNNFLSKGRMNIPTSGFENILGTTCLGMFSHIKQLYTLEEHKSLKIAHSLKKVALNPSNIAKTSPQHALCVFSESTANALNYYCTTYPNFASTRNFVTFINKLWKVMSLKTPSKGLRKNDELCTPLSFNTEGSHNCTLVFLENAVKIFKQWKASGQSGLTSETFTATIQSMEAMIALATYLMSKHGFSYILPGKFTSDPIEGRFGWYHQVNGGNFYMSILQLFQAEKKIHCLSLLRQKTLHTLASLNTKQPIAFDDHAECTEDLTWLKDWIMQTQFNDLSDDDTAAVIYYVAGYIGRCVSRRRKCAACKDLLIETENIPSLSNISEAKDMLLAIADRGGLSAPMQYCYAICALGVQVHTKLSDDEQVRQKFLCLNNQRSAFVAAISKLVEETPEHALLLKQTCDEGHYNFLSIVRSLFNCFAKNELKRINQCEIEPPAKMNRGVRKLTSKSTPKR